MSRTKNLVYQQIRKALAIAPAETWTLNEALEVLSLLNQFVTDRRGRHCGRDVIHLPS